MNVLEVIRNELKQATLSRQIALEYVKALPIATDEIPLDRYHTGCDMGENTYWVPWSDYLGAWVSADGKAVKVCITESARSLAPAELTLGFTSVLTGVCLNLQSQIAIHANAVALNGQAIAFIGYSGMGKSTLSAYCVGRGAGLVTDDVLAVDPQGTVLPGNPRIKLYPETGAALGLDASTETTYKIFYHPEQSLGSSFAQASIPLKYMYLLADTEEDRVYTEIVSPTQAVFELMTHGYDVSYFIAQSPGLFDAFIRLANQVPLRRLIYPRSFERLPQVYELLLTESCAS